MPAVTPVTIPLADPIVAFAVLLLHVPPAVASLNVVAEPIQTVPDPVIAEGFGGTLFTYVV
jgi:hypothetical protein